MKSRLLLLGAAIAAISAGGVLAASAQPHHACAEGREGHRMDISRIDANGDKFVSRAEAQAEVERVFAELDSNHDGKLDAADHGPHGSHFMHRVEVHDGDHEERNEDVSIEHGDAPGAGGENRQVIIRRDVRGDDDHGPRPPHRPHPPHPPMFMMIIAHSEEADRNGDGALSKEEFVAQHLRFFDAADANGDGKIKFDPPPMMMMEPPEPPQPPEPPAPPQPPRR